MKNFGLRAGLKKKAPALAIAAGGSWVVGTAVLPFAVVANNGRMISPSDDTLAARLTIFFLCAATLSLVFLASALVGFLSWDFPRRVRRALKVLLVGAILLPAYGLGAFILVVGVVLLLISWNETSLPWGAPAMLGIACLSISLANFWSEETDVVVLLAIFAGMWSLWGVGWLWFGLVLHERATYVDDLPRDGPLGGNPTRSPNEKS